LILSVLYRKEGPQKPVYEWMDAEEGETGGLGEGESIILEDDETENDEETKRRREEETHIL
jgi:hypothetical protein